MGRTISNTGTNISNNLIGDDAINVTSAAGFTAGDYVYNYGGDYATAPSAPSGVTISTPTTAVLPNRANDVALPNADSYVAAVGQSLYTQNTAAKLSNGNIVLAYLSGATSNSGYPYFKIIDETGATVVAATQIEATAANTRCQIGVVALSGGGFAVVWATTTPNIRLAVYSNTGTVVTAPTTDATITLTASYLQISLAARPVSGGFVVGAISSSNPSQYKVYSSTGVQVYAWTTILASAQCVAVSCRSDDSIFVSSAGTGAILWALYNSTNTLVATNSFTGPTTYPTNRLSSTTLSNDTVVIAYTTYSAGYGVSYRTLPTTNVMGSEVIVITPSGGSVRTVRAQSLSEGRFALLHTVTSNINYLVYDSAGNLQNTSNASVYSFSGIVPNADVALFSPVETTTYINFFVCAGYKSSTPTYTNPGPNTISCYRVVKAAVNTLTYTPYWNGSQTTTTGTSNVSVAANTYVKDSSGPVVATYTSTSVGTTSYTEATVSGTSFIVPAVTIDAVNAASTVSSTTLPNGNFVIAYRYTASPYTVRIAVYTPTGSFVNSYTVGNNVSSHLYNIRVIALDNGNVAVAYASATNTISLVVYNSSFTVLNTVSITAGTGTAGWDFDIAALTGSRILAVYKSSTLTQSNYSVYDSTGASLVASTILVNGVYFNCGIAGDQVGGFYFTASGGTGSTLAAYYYAPSGTNTWTQNTLTNTNSYGCFVSTIKPAVSSDGSMIYAAWDPLSGPYVAVYAGPQNSANINYSTQGNVLTNTSVALAGVDGYGNPFNIYATGTALTSYNYYGFAASAGSTISNPSITLTTSTSTSTGNTVSTTPSVGHRVCIAYVGTYAAFIVVNMAAYTTYSYSTAGATTGTYNLTPQNGYIMAGIAASTASAGGNGVIQVNGQAQVSSSYQSQATAAPFDSTSPTGFGTKGVVLGRTVTMQRNA